MKNLAARHDHDGSADHNFLHSGTLYSGSDSAGPALYCFSTILTKLQRLGEKKMNFQEKQGVPAHVERRNHNFNPIPIMVRIRGKGESLEKKCLQEK